MRELNIVYSKNYHKFDLGEDNPIVRDKAQMFLQRLEQEGNIPYVIHEAPMASDEDILLVHTSNYLAEVKYCAINKLELSPDTPVNENTLEATRYIIGGTILCLNLALRGKRAINLIGGMHHASSHAGSGFCIFNDHAIAIRKLQKEGKIKTATIFDVDVHAGQGTQQIFYEDPSVLTISIHQDPHTIYPGVGFDWQKGMGRGMGANINFPLHPGTGENDYLRALDAALEQSKSFSQDITILVLGVDTYKEDQLGGLLLEVDSYRKIGERFKEFDKIAVLFGGGYSRKIPDLWLSFLSGYL